MIRLNKILTAAALIVLSGTALAEPPADKNSDREPALRGPAVRDGGVPGMRRHFGDEGNMQGRMANRMPPQAFVRALDAVRGDKVDEAVRLTPEQDEKIRGIMNDFRASMQKFQEEHKAEFEAMRPRRGDSQGPRPDGERREAGGPEDRPAGPKPDGQRRQQFEELMAQAPKPEDAQAAVFNVLTDAQKPLVQARLEEIKKDMAERRLEGPAREYAKRQIEKGGKGGPKGGAKGGPKGKGGPEGRQFNPDNLPPKLKEKLEGMTPEEKAEAIKQFREKMGKRGGPGGPGGPGRGGPGMEKLLEKLTPEQKAELESMTPEERRDLFRKLRDQAIENGEIPPGPPEGRRGNRPQPPKDE